MNDDISMHVSGSVKLTKRDSPPIEIDRLSIQDGDLAVHLAS